MLQPLNDEHVLLWDVVGVDGRAIGCADARGVNQVLVCDGQAVQHTDVVAALQGVIGSLRVFERLLRMIGYDGVDLRVHAVNLCQVRLHHLNA